jgi:hypothetical protein
MVDLILNEVQILLGELLVFEDHVFASLSEHHFVELFKVIVVQLTTKDTGIDLIAELLDLLYLFVSHLELGCIILSYQEHSVILLPVVLEVSVLNNDEVNNIKSR